MDLVLLVIAALAAVVWWLARRRDQPREGTELPADPELSAMLDEVAREEAPGLARRLQQSVDGLEHRRVPVRRLMRSPTGWDLRVRFADSTILLGHGRERGDALRLATALHEGRHVWISSRDEASEEGLPVTLTADGQEILVMLVVGLDQAD